MSGKLFIYICPNPEELLIDELLFLEYQYSAGDVKVPSQAQQFSSPSSWPFYHRP